MSKETGGSAFPEIETDPAYDEDRELYGRAYTYGGMTLRDYFAAHAPLPPDSWHGGDWKRGVSASSITEWNYYYADTMLKTRAQT